MRVGQLGVDGFSMLRGCVAWGAAARQFGSALSVSLILACSDGASGDGSPTIQASGASGMTAAAATSGGNAAGTHGARVSGASGSGGAADASSASTMAASANASGAGGNASAAGAGASRSGEAGSAGSGTSTTHPATFETVKLVLGGGGAIMTCAAAPCHGVNGTAPPADPLALPTNDDAKLYANPTSYVSKACNGTKLVDPGKPDQSALVTILKGPCGNTPRMPYGCTTEGGDCIPDEYIAAVAAWIANGARQ